MLFSSLEELSEEPFLLNDSMTTKKVMCKICLTTKLQELRLLQHVKRGVIFSMFSIPCSTDIFKFGGIVRIIFFVVRFNCNKKVYVRNLPSFKIEGATRIETRSVVYNKRNSVFSDLWHLIFAVWMNCNENCCV